MGQIGGWIDGRGGLFGEGISAISRALDWNGAAWREGYCQRAFGICAVARRRSEPRPLYLPSETGNLVLYTDGEAEGGAEAIARAYRNRSVASFADSLRGSFAFALLDEERGELLLARSQDGETPFFFAESGHRLVFSSQIKGVLALLPEKKRIKTEKLSAWIGGAFRDRSPVWLYDGVCEFPRGQTMVCSRFGRVTVSHEKRLRPFQRSKRGQFDGLPKSKAALWRALYGELLRWDAPIFYFPPCSARERKMQEGFLWELLSEQDERTLSLLCGGDWRSRIAEERGEERIDCMARLCQAAVLAQR